MADATKTTGFDRALAFTLKYEGGYANVPGDHGGPTMRGITQHVYDAYRHVRGLPLRPVSQIADAELRDIYMKQYWLPSRCDQLEAPLAIALFDFAVNSGPPAAVEHLQRIVNVPVDGYFGPQTLRAVSIQPQRTLATLLCDDRERFFHSLAARPGQGKFLKGWLNRVHALREVVNGG